MIAAVMFVVGFVAGGLATAWAFLMLIIARWEPKR